MQLEKLQDVFIEQLKDLFSAENQILKALPKLAKAASSADLKRAFEEHLEQTRTHVERLEKVMETAEATGRGKTCKRMQGLLEEGAETLKLKGDASPAALDAAMIADAKPVEPSELRPTGRLL